MKKKNNSFFMNLLNIFSQISKKAWNFKKG